MRRIEIKVSGVGSRNKLIARLKMANIIESEAIYNPYFGQFLKSISSIVCLLLFISSNCILVITRGDPDSGYTYAGG
jgi:hypothetical protein